MAKLNRSEIGLLILAGIGAGTLIGATVGLLLGRRAAGRTDAAIAESVDELKERAEQVLAKLSGNVSGMVESSGSFRAETRSAP
jgi:gas vesicle protein